MDQESYNKKIEYILSRIEYGDYSVVDKELRELDNVYPKMLGYYLCYESFKCKTIKGYTPYEAMCGKMYYIYDYPYVKKMMQLYEMSCTGKWGRDYFKNCLKIICNDDGAYCAFEDACLLCKKENNPFELCKETYDVLDAYAFVIHLLVTKKKYPDLVKVTIPEAINKAVNMQYFREKLEEKAPMVIIESENYRSITPILLQDLQYLEIPLCYVKQPMEITESELEQIWDKTLSSIEKRDGITYITPVAVRFSDEFKVNNVDDVLQYIKDEIFCTDIVGVLGEMQYLERLSVTPSLQKKFYKITTGMMSRSYRCLNYALYGNYLSYISSIYNEDIDALIHKPAKTKFSIIIPARNSAATLRYTLSTCLNQTYRGEYEIIVSDNSTGQNAEVYGLCKEINDERIVYLKTPRDLSLPKSFEFAYTHAKGEYIFSVGSDDGLLPWALEEIDKITKEYPDELIIHWERGSYAWPGFNGGQENQFIYPREYQREKYDIYYRNGMDYIAELLICSDNMYGLPTLYVNSCFKREYFDVLLEKTGRLWDGVCQDIYMGIVTAVINPKILYAKFPMAVFGLSSKSVGFNSNKGIETDEEFKKILNQRQLDGNVGGYYETYYECLCPSTSTDTYSLVKSLLRMISIGLLPESYIDGVFPWKDWYVRLAAELDIKDVSFDAKIHEMRYCASLLGEEFLAWFDSGIYEIKTRPKIIEPKQENQAQIKPTYTKSRVDTGGFMLDASEYGVTNIAEAVQLFADIMDGKVKVEI